MRRTLFLTIGACWLVVVVLAAAPPASPGPPPQGATVPAPAAVTPKDPANPRPTAGFLGADTCDACHDEQEHSYLDSPHGKATNPRAPAAMHQCETCHGPGEKHLDDPTVDGSIRKFAKMAPRDVNGVCLSCHTGAPHTAWQLLEHLRIAQWDILEFSRNAEHISPEFPTGYWPATETPPTPDAWDQSIAAYRADHAAMMKLAEDPATDLFSRIPWGEGQTLLREALLVADHAAYHVGQLVMLRRMQGH